MLLALLICWAGDGKPHYAWMAEKQTIPYISDIGASSLQPLFIAMSAVTVVTFDLVFIIERWLRHKGRLTPNTSVWQKVYAACSIIAAIIGAAGLILLSIFDVAHHKRMHDTFLGVFILGYVVSAIFVCWQYQRLGIHYRQHSVLRASFWMKLFFILAEVCLAIAFGTTSKTHRYNAAAVLEWTIAFLYGFYVISYAVDFLPALQTKHHKHDKTEMQVAEEGGQATMGDGAVQSQQYFRHNGPHTNGHTSHHTGHNQYTQPTQSVAQSSTNF